MDPLSSQFVENALKYTRGHISIQRAEAHKSSLVLFWMGVPVSSSSSPALRSMLRMIFDAREFRPFNLQREPAIVNDKPWKTTFWSKWLRKASRLSTADQIPTEAQRANFGARCGINISTDSSL